MNRIRFQLQERQSFFFVFAVLFVLGAMSGCATVTGLPRASHVDMDRVFQHVQVLENYYGSSFCNRDYCGVLFTHGNSGFFLPRVYSLGPGRPADFNLAYLIPYQVSDGSVVFAPPASDPTEYTIPSGQIRIQFGIRPDVPYSQFPAFGGTGF